MALNDIKNAVKNCKIKAVEGLVKQELENGTEPKEILDSMVDAMSDIGEMFQNNQIFVPEMLVAAMTMKKGVAVLKPALGGEAVGSKGKFIIGTVAGDMHDIGKNLVALMVESAGFEVIDLGVDVPASKFVETIKANPDCALIGLSSLLTTTMEAMKQTVREIESAGLRGQVKIMVGGAPITQEFCDEIGADAYTLNAGAAAQKAKELI